MIFYSTVILFGMELVVLEVAAAVSSTILHGSVRPCLSQPLMTWRFEFVMANLH